MDSVSYDDCCMLPFDKKNPFVPVLGTDKIKILITPPEIKKSPSKNLSLFRMKSQHFQISRYLKIREGPLRIKSKNLLL